MIDRTNIKRISIYIVFIFFLLFNFGSGFVLAQSPPPPANNTNGPGIISGMTYICNHGGDNGNCDFADVIAAILNLVNVGVKIALSLSVIVLAWAGYNYMVSGSNPSKRSDANKMLWKVVVGIVLILAAWLIVNLITSALLGKSLDSLTI